MPTLSIQPPYPIFTDSDGTPLEDGYVWLGSANLDPQTNPIAVYWNEALTQPASQPIRTIGGYPSNNGTPGRLYVNSDYSIRVMNKNGSSLYSSAFATEQFSGVVVQIDATNVTFTQSGSSTQRTVQLKLNEVFSVLDFGAIGDGIANDSAAFIAARTAAAGKRIYVPAGTYKINQSITSGEDLIIEGDGPSTVLDFSGTVSGGSYGLDAIGTATQIQALGATATVGTYTVTFASPPSLTAGDVFVIFNPTASSWSGFRTNYFAGEWCEVDSVSGNVVTVRNQLYDTYLSTDVDVYKVTGPKVSLRNFTIKGTTVTGLIRTSLCISPLIENIASTHANNSIVYFDRCFKPTVINPDMSNIGGGGDDYGIAIGNSQHVKVMGGNIYSRRHAVTTGGNAEICAVPVRDARIIGVTIKNDTGSGTFAADFHGNTEDSSYIGCTIYGGATWQGKDNEYVNCTITSDVGGRVIYSAEIKGGKFSLRGCKLITHVNPATSSRGIVDIGGNNLPVTGDTVLNCTFSVIDCSLYGRNLSGITSFVRFVNRGTNQKVNIAIDNVEADVDAIGNVLITSLVSGSADSDFVVVDRIKNFPSGTLLHNATAAYRDFPHRLQKQSGSEVIEATAGLNFVPGVLTTLKYVYPRTPSAFVSGTTNFNGNVAALPNLNLISTTQIRLIVISADATNWTSTTNRNLYWSTFIDEV